MHPRMTLKIVNTQHVFSPMCYWELDYSLVTFAEELPDVTISSLRTRKIKRKHTERDALKQRKRERGMERWREGEGERDGAGERLQFHLVSGFSVRLL